MDRAALEQLLTEGKDNSLLRYTLAGLCLKAGEAEAAVTHLEAGLSLDEGHSASWKLYGKALVELGKREEAKKAYEKGIVVAESKGDIQAAKEMKVFLRRLQT